MKNTGQFFMYNIKMKKIFIALVFFSATFPSLVFAHHSGCHTLHTCPSDSNSYVCGDLGYPCDGSVSAAKISLSAIKVPLVVEAAFGDVFARKPTDRESFYWKNRFRNDKDGLYKIRKTMRWHRENGNFGPPSLVISENRTTLTQRINAIFRSVYGREPSVAENKYWLGRIKDKPTEETLRGAMGWHKARKNNIEQ